jgi:hypothetical protein
MFATSLAQTLKSRYNQVDYLIGFPQMKELLENNPYIDLVLTSEIAGPKPTKYVTGYNRVIELGPLNYQVTPCEEYYQQAELDYNGQQYQVYTNPHFDLDAKRMVSHLHNEYGKPVVGVMMNWQSKTYIFTPEQYEAGIDVPGLGYGGAHRDVQSIIDELQHHFTLLPIGFDSNISQHHTLGLPTHDKKSLLYEASLLKYCDVFIGTEGGLANLAAGIGCKTILTGDFIHQLYGPNGCIKKITYPQLGPNKYFPEFGHLMLNPYYTDKEVTNEIIKGFNGEL